jgi:hypothetical protein
VVAVFALCASIGASAEVGSGTMVSMALVWTKHEGEARRIALLKSRHAPAARRSRMQCVSLVRHC